MLFYHIPKQKRSGYIATLFVFGVIFGFLWYYHSFSPSTPSSTTTASSSVQEESGVGTLYEDIQEKDFVTFALHVIEKRCPLYVPDGTTYRECLATWVEEVERKNIPESVDEVHNYCSTWVKSYADQETLLSQELFAKCVVFKLQ
jgi:hypothetical protein